MKKSRFFLLALIVSFAARSLLGADSGPKTHVQDLVDRMTAEHIDLLTIGVHAKAPHSNEWTIVAHTQPKAVGAKSAGADIVTLESGKPDGPNPLPGYQWDVGLPLRDSSGAIFAFVAMHVKPDPKSADGKAAALQLGEKYRDEFAKEIPNAAALFEPAP